MTYLEHLRASVVRERLRSAAGRLRTMIARLWTAIGRVRSFAGRRRVRAVLEPHPRLRPTTASVLLSRLQRMGRGFVRGSAGLLRFPALSRGLRFGAARRGALVERLRAWIAPLPATGRRTTAAAVIVILGCAAFAVSRWWPVEQHAADRLHVETGDTVASLFSRAGLSDDDLLAVMEADGGTAFDIALVPGEEVRITRGDDGRLRRLILGRGNGEATAFVADESGRWFTIEEHVPPGPPDGERPESAEAREPPRGPLTEEPRQSPEAPALSRRGAPEDAPARNGGPARPEVAAGPSPADAGPAPSSEPADDMERVEVRTGDSLFGIFDRNGLPQADLAALLSRDESAEDLKRLLPGQSIAFQRGEDGRLVRFELEVDDLTILRFLRDERGFTAETITRDYDRHIAGKNGIIESSLFAAAAGVPDQVIMQLVSVLDWDIDFDRDVRRGDSFSILYEELRVDDRLIRAGDILALEFQSRRTGESIRAYRYTDTDRNTDYFAPDGRSLRRAFMRNPIRQSRISSRFSHRRLHPVYKTVRPHRGVDYAAPTGTPIRATGDGRVTWAGRKGGYGKTVILSHGNGYSTLYAHLSRYARGTKKGAWIRQGAVLGRVGATGVATGPHLHYEFRIDGVHKDPLTVKLPRAEPLDEAELKRFQDVIEPLVARLDTLGATRLASLGH